MVLARPRDHQAGQLTERRAKLGDDLGADLEAARADRRPERRADLRG